MINNKAKGYLISKIRLAWRYYSEKRKECLLAKVCTKCEKRTRDLFADHVTPVVPLTGWVGWDAYITSMFDGEHQPLCEGCHKLKTLAENKLRTKLRKEAKK